jgi:hypothetical protein
MSGLFAPSPLEFGESANKGGEARFMVRAVELCPVPSLKRGFHRKFKKAASMLGWKIHAPNNLSVNGTWLVFQEEVILE